MRTRDGPDTSSVPSRMAASGRPRATHGWPARGSRAPRPHADESGEREPRGLDARPDVGRPNPAALIERVEAGRERDAGEHAGHRRDHADDQTLGRGRHRDLSPRRAEGPQQRRLARALCRHHRERVVDAERRDEERHRREHEQDRLEEADERAVDVGLLLGRELRAGDRSGPGGQGRLQLAHQLGLARPPARRRPAHR